MSADDIQYISRALEGTGGKNLLFEGTEIHHYIQHGRVLGLIFSIFRLSVSVIFLQDSQLDKHIKKCFSL